MASSFLKVEGLTKRFGGVVTADALAFDIPEGECHAIIGPNGAGKTTLISLLAGEISAQGGTISFDGADITPLPPYRRSLAGIARSFQISSLFPDFSALDNVALAVQAHRGHSFHFWRNARHDERLRGPALKALGRVALADRADVRVGRLSHGEHRQLEIAIALSTQPRVLLLDEPMAGMVPDESAAMLKLLRELKDTLTIVLVEHDMETVFALADRVTVMVYGRIIACGEPAAIRNDPDVRRAYLGEQQKVAAQAGNA